MVAALALAGVRCANTSVFLPPLSIQLAILHRRCALPAAQSARAAYPAMTHDDAQKISWIFIARSLRNSLSVCRVADPALTSEFEGRLRILF